MIKRFARQMDGKKSLPLPPALKRARIAEKDDAKKTPPLEIEHVKNVYDSIAKHWHGTRYKAWPKVQAFIEKQQKGTTFADIGCGNGKNMPAANELGISVGSDISLELGKIAAERGLEIICADIVNLPYRTAFFDAGLCIAVLHHISTQGRRLLALRECMRVIKPGGSCLFYAWAKEQSMPESSSEQKSSAGGDVKEGRSGHEFAEADVLVPWHLKRPQKKGERPTEEDLEFAANEELRSFLAEHATFSPDKNAFVFQRYCHVYEREEIEDLVRTLQPEVALEQIYWDTGNWAFVLRNEGN